MADMKQASNYILNNEKSQQEYVEDRSAEKWIPFLLPHLKSGFNVLDCGCGVGSISMDIAELVYPGQVIGIDMDERQLELARKKANDRGIKNITFEKADVYALRFEAESFDAVIAHTLLIHLKDQLKALKELHRLLKPKGMVCISDDDWGTSIDSPETPLSGKNIELMTKVIIHNGGNPYYSRNLRSLLIQAGFDENEGFAHAPEFYGNLAETKRIVSIVNRILQGPEFVSLVVDQGWATQNELNELVERNLQWAVNSDSFATYIYCAAIGWKLEGC